MRMTTWRRLVVVLGLAVFSIAASRSDVPLADAAKNADWGAMRALLEQGTDVNTPQGDGTTALHWAAYWNDTESTELLIRAGADVNVSNDLGSTPLWTACENGSSVMVQRLLQAGANPNAALLSGETALMTAARTGNADVVQQLLTEGADLSAKEAEHHQTALMWAVAQRHADVVEVLLAAGGDVDARSKVWIQTVKTSPAVMNPAYWVDIRQGGYTPLLFAARVGDLTSAKLLVAAGADVNDTAPYGTSATVVAAHSGHGGLATFLLERGADPNSEFAGYTALHASLLRKDEELVRTLLANGANPNAPVLKPTPTRRDSIDFYLSPGFVGATPLWLAARFSTPEIMRLLIEHDADPMFVHRPVRFVGGPYGGPRRLLSEGDTTVLMAAAGMGGEAPVFAIDRRSRIAEGAPIDVQRRKPDPVELEALTLEAVKIAAKSGVDVNVANADGNTALHSTAAHGYDSVITFLVENGARLDMRNKRGHTPLDSAIRGSMSGAARQGRFGRYASPPKATTAELLRRLGAQN